MTNDNDNDNSDSDSEASDNEIYEFHHRNNFTIQEIRDNFLSQRNNLVIFVTQRGNTCDTGAKILGEANKLPMMENAILAHAQPVLYKYRRYIISLIVKGRISAIIEKEIVQESMYSLHDVMDKLGLNSFAICRGDIDQLIIWAEVYGLIRIVFCEIPVNIIICTNAITISDVEERDNIIKENHASATATKASQKLTSESNPNTTGLT